MIWYRCHALVISFMIPISIVLITVFSVLARNFAIYTSETCITSSSTYDFGPSNICKIIIGFIVVMWIVAIMAKIIYKILEKIDVKRNKIKR